MGKSRDVQLINLRSFLFPAACLLIGTRFIAAQSPCVPPDDMKPQLQGKPTAEALNNLGVWFADQKQYACAADVFASSMQLEPNQKDVAHIAFEFGVALDLSGDLKEAIPVFQEAEQLGYLDIKIHVLLAQAFDATHDSKGAEAEWRAAIDIDPEYSPALDALSNDLLADKDFDGVIAALERPRLAGQRTPLQSANLGVAYASNGELDQADAVLRDGLNTTPDSLMLANLLANVLVGLHRGDEAVTVLQLALIQHPGDADTTAHLASIRTAKPARN